MLGGVAVAYHRLFDLRGFILLHRKTCLPNGKQYHAPALSHADAGSYVLAEKQFFNCHSVRLCQLQQLSHILVNNLQPGRKIHACRRGDGAAAQQTESVTLRIDEAEAGNAVAGVNAQDPHYAPPLKMFR